MFGQTVVPGALVKGNTFLLNPANRGFLDGSERKLHDFTRSTVWVYAFMILLFGGMGGAFVFFGVREIVTRQQLDQQGVDTKATVTNVEHTTSTDSHGSRTDHYTLTYKFYVTQENGDKRTAYTYEQSVSSTTYNDLYAGDTILIRYLPTDPTISRYLSDTSDNGIVGTVVGSIFFVPFVLVILYFGIRQKSRNTKLENEGQLLVGKITEAKGSRTKNGYTVSIRYTFRTPEGVELNRKESRIRSDLRTSVLPAEGTPVAVLYANEKLYRML